MHEDLREYDAAWSDLNRELDAVVASGLGLDAALRALHDQQLDRGFIRDDLTRARRYLIKDPTHSDRHFSAQFNPARANRFQGAGKKQPPPGAVSLNEGCFLCRENVQWQQQGREFGYELDIEDRYYVAWVNPYPLLPNHMVIASREHMPQTWRVNGSEHPTKSLRTIVTDLLTLASRLPGWIGFYNGAGAGASIPNHFHYQFMPRPDDYGPFPLERAAAGKRPSSCVLDDAYPLEFAHWHGNIEDLLDQAVPWLNAWVRADGAELTANVIAIAGECTRELDLYFVPRDPNRSGSAVMSGSIGGLEVLGELIFSNEEERQRLENGDIDCVTVESLLSSIAVAIR
jgi:diadenosine tetraphosphate (Ap4A) HIT family hydrolase